MSLNIIKIVLVLTPMISIHAQEQTPEANNVPGYECKFVQETRTLNVVKNSEGNGCELQYFKYGVKEIPATSKSGQGICLKVMDKIKDKLESVGFDCRPNSTK